MKGVAMKPLVVALVLVTCEAFALNPSYCSCRIFCGTDTTIDRDSGVPIRHPLITGPQGPTCPNSLPAMIQIAALEARVNCRYQQLPVSRVDCDPKEESQSGISFVPGSTGRKIPSAPRIMYLE